MGTEEYPNDINEAIKAARALIDIIPEEARKDLLHPIAKSAGRGGSSIIDLLFYHPNKWAMIKNHDLAVLQKKLEEETTEKIEELMKKNRYTDKKIGLAVKAIDQSIYSLDSDVLRSFFAELITRSVDKESADDVHPIFASILSNMSIKEAEFLSRLKREYGLSKNYPLLRIERDDGNTSTYLKEAIFPWSKNEVEEIEFVIYGLASYGFFEIHYDRALSGDLPNNLYSAIEDSKLYKELIRKEILRKGNAGSIKVKKGYIKTTSLGLLFMSLVVV